MAALTTDTHTGFVNNDKTEFDFLSKTTSMLDVMEDSERFVIYMITKELI